jgi:hypothetical protein
VADEIGIQTTPRYEIERLVEDYNRTGDIETLNKAIDAVKQVMSTT